MSIWSIRSHTGFLFLQYGFPLYNTQQNFLSSGRPYFKIPRPFKTNYSLLSSFLTRISTLSNKVIDIYFGQSPIPSVELIGPNVS